MSFPIKSTSCEHHTIPSNYKIHILDKAVYQYHLADDNYYFIVESCMSTVITLSASLQVNSHIVIVCYTPIDVTVRFLSLFSERVYINISLILCAPLAKISFFGLSVLHVNQIFDMQTTQLHCAQQTESTLVLQGVVGGSAQFAYQGLIRIEERASGSYALQNNKNILLSSTATAKSVPNIEVLRHDVQCYHGAAIGKFDELSMHYMQARGLEHAKIKELLLQAFCAQVLDGYEKKDLILQMIYEKI